MRIYNVEISVVIASSFFLHVSLRSHCCTFIRVSYTSIVAGVDGVAGLPGLAGIAHPSDVLDMPVDPNEPTYCLCHQVSYGEMIGCDNPDVSTI